MLLDEGEKPIQNGFIGFNSRRNIVWSNTLSAAILHSNWDIVNHIMAGGLSQSEVNFKAIEYKDNPDLDT